MHFVNSDNTRISDRITELKNILSQKVDIMAVVKYANDTQILSLIKDGRIKIIGENRVQDAEKRWERRDFLDIRKNLDIHFIGHLQKNKVKRAVLLFDSIDSVDSIELAEEIDKKSAQIGKIMPVMIQIKISDKETQYGIKPEDFDFIFENISRMKNISIRGIMAIGAMSDKEEEIRASFKKAADIYKNYFKNEFNSNGEKNYLSMGMSGDWRIAIEEGSNLIRIGNYFFDNKGV
ncbi:MAG: YggS family pyridoxal phosphate-dependent enzyme [Elusimicrobiota bacterium]